MQGATPSCSAPPYSGGVGAGGKFRKPPVSRKRPSTPYDRPSLTNNKKAVEPQDGGGGWLSKLVVNPARRLIVGGATRILPSFFSNSDSTSADEYEDDPPSDHENQDVDTTVNGSDDAEHALELGASRWSGDAGPSNKVDKLKGKLEHNNIEQDQSMNLSGDLDVAKIENMLKGKRFSRDESNRLMEILNSRLADVSNAEEEKNAPHVIYEGQAKDDVSNREIPSTLKQYNVETALMETPMPRLQANIQDEVVASPIDIARAYMGSRTSELGFNSYSIISKGGKASKPHILTPSKSTCWPGAMIQDQRGFLTPQNQRSRYGLHNFPRTPYSRTIYSRTKPKLTELQADSRPSNFSSTTFQPSRTPNYSQMKTSNDLIDGGYGSVGPIRRVRNKFASEPHSEKRHNPYSTQITSSPNASRSFTPIFQKNPKTSGTSITLNPEKTSKGEATTHIPLNETARKILEQLDRHKPTPKEKAAELKLATEWKKPSSQNTISTPKENTISDTITKSTLQKSVFFPSEDRLADGGGSFKGMPVSNATSKSVDYAGAGPSFGFGNIGVANEKTTVTNTELNQINGQDLTKKRPSQPILKPISFKRPDPQRVISSDNGRGFTFPFSTAATSSASEPPTPSIMPSFPPPAIFPPKEPPAAGPTYSFGSKKSGERIVFSFPSTSNAPAKDGASDLKFNFGSDNKRVSFGSIGSDAIVIN